MKIDVFPLVIPVISSQPLLAQYFQLLDGLLLVGGPDLDPVHYHQSPKPGLRRVTPLRDAVELQMSRWALEAGLPIFAICRGIQVLNVAAGGTLCQDIATERPDAAKHDYHPGYPETHLAHPVQIHDSSRLADIVGQKQIWVNSLHHQAIDRLGKDLQPTAFAPDGIVEAVEGMGKEWVLGVQWHPEWLVETDERMRALFQAFRRACCANAHKTTDRG
jgi:putative glutamine amidotransferase